MAVLDPGHRDIIDRAADAFPPSGGTPVTLYLDARDGEMRPEPPATEATASYLLADPTSHAEFRYTFDRDVELIGSVLLSLWVSAEGHDDANLYVVLEKRDAEGASSGTRLSTLRSRSRGGGCRSCTRSG